MRRWALGQVQCNDGLTSATVMFSMVSVWQFLGVRPDSKEEKTVWERGGRVGESGGELYNVDHHNGGIAH